MIIVMKVSVRDTAVLYDVKFPVFFHICEYNSKGSCSPKQHALSFGANIRGMCTCTHG